MSTGLGKQLLRRAQQSIAPPLIGAMIRSLGHSWSVRAHGRSNLTRLLDADRRFLLVHWHAHLVAAFFARDGNGCSYLISRHRDGQMIARVGERFGFNIVNGSTSQGAVSGTRDLIRAVRRGQDLGLTPDGPRGPARVVQPGCVAIAQLLQIPILPFAVAARRAWRLGSWDRTLIPRPGSEVLFGYGAALEISKAEPVEQGVARVQAALDQLCLFVDSALDDPSGGERLEL